jgi:hypothetical protein
MYVIPKAATHMALLHNNDNFKMKYYTLTLVHFNSLLHVTMKSRLTKN